MRTTFPKSKNNLSNIYEVIGQKEDQLQCMMQNDQNISFHLFYLLFVSNYSREVLREGKEYAYNISEDQEQSIYV